MLKFRGHVKRMGGERKRSFLGVLPDQFDSYKHKDQVIPARYFRIPAFIARFYYVVIIICLVIALGCAGGIAAQSGLGLNLDYNQFRLNNDPLTQNSDLQQMVISQLSLSKATIRPSPLSTSMPLQNYGFNTHARKLLAYISSDHFLLIYRRKDSGDVLSLPYLQQIYSLETYLLAKLEWSKYCVPSKIAVGCNAQDGYQSIFNYVGVAGRVQNFNYTDYTNPFAQEKIGRFGQFFDVSYSRQRESAKYLITYLTTDHSRTRTSNQELFQNFDTIIEDLQGDDWPEGSQQWPDIDVIWMGGTANFEFLTALKHDLLFAVLSFALVWIYGVIHTGSVFLASLGLLGVIMSFPLTILATMGLYGKIFGFVDIVGLWIMAGIGIDNIFVFLDSWKSTPRHDVFNRPVSLAHRLSTTYKKATPAMFACTITTGGAFFADFVTSRITPISEFGFFMFFVIFYNFFHVMTWFPALIIAHERLPYCCSRRCRCYKKQMAAIEEEDAYRRKLYIKFLWIHSARRAVGQARGIGESVKKVPTSVREVSLFPLSTTPHFLPPHHTGKAKMMLAYGKAVNRFRFSILAITLAVVVGVGSQLIFIGAPEGLPQLLGADTNFERTRVVQTAVNAKGYVGGSLLTGFSGNAEVVRKGNVSYSIRQNVRTLSPFTPATTQVFASHLFPASCGTANASLTSDPMAATLASGQSNSVVDCAPFPYLLPYFGPEGTPLIELPAQPKSFDNITCIPTSTGGLDIVVDLFAAAPSTWQVAVLMRGSPSYWLAIPNLPTLNSPDVVLHVDPGILRESQVYQFRIVAVGSNPDQISQVSEISTPCSPVGISPRAVLNLTFTPNSTSFVARWSFPPDFDGGAPLTALTLSFRPSSSTSTNTSSLALQATSYMPTSLLPQTQYVVTVTGANSHGTGIAVIGLVMTLPPPPDPIVNVTFGSFGFGRRLLSIESSRRLLPDPMCYPISSYPYPTGIASWQAPVSNDVNGITAYQLRVITPSTTGFSCSNNRWLACDINTLPITPSCNVSLVYNVQLSIEVRSKNSESWSDWSTPALAPLLFYLPEPPRILRTVLQNCSSLTLAWDTSTNNAPDPVNYTLFCNSVANVTGITTSFLTLPVSPTPVVYTVVACNSVGCSPSTNALSMNGTACPTPVPTNAPTVAPTLAPTRLPTTGSPVSTSPTTWSPTTMGPVSTSPTSRSPTSDSPTTKSPVSTSPTTMSPTSDSPTTMSPVSTSPTTMSPTSNSPTTPIPTTRLPTSSPTTPFPTFSPTTALPTPAPTPMPSLAPTPTNQPLTAAPSIAPTVQPTPFPTYQPSTLTPTTTQPSLAPTTGAPQSTSPSTGQPTHLPTTLQPTNLPTTLQPTNLPTTLQPTNLPTTSLPTTQQPSTAQPTTNAPSTSQPTTQQPSTARPTTNAPSQAPSLAPSNFPTTKTPTAAPSLAPSNFPTTKAPTNPTGAPTTLMPTTLTPTNFPTNLPTQTPSTKAPSLTPTTAFPTDAPTTRAPTPRPTQSFGSVSLTASMEVLVTWGVTSLDTSTANSDRTVLGTPIRYPGFSIQNVAAQGFLKDACDFLLREPDLYARPETQGTRCVFERFAASRSFPIADRASFDSQLLAYLKLFPEFNNDIGFDGNTTNATYVSIRILTSVPSNLGSADMQVIAQSYQTAMDSLNARSPASVGPGFATASPWPQMAVEQHFIASTRDAIIISLCICFAALAIFTENVYLAICTTLFLMMECLFMLGIFGCFRWTLGAIEAVSLSIIIGLSVDYFLHVAHWYSRTLAQTRYEKTLEMLSKIGFSVFSAAAVAILACGVLGFCKLFVFARVGTIISVTILAAVCLSLISLVALFFVLGPQFKNGWFGNLCCCCHRKHQQREEQVDAVIQMQILTGRRPRKAPLDDGKEALPPYTPPVAYLAPAWLPPLFEPVAVPGQVLVASPAQLVAAPTQSVVPPSQQLVAHPASQMPGAEAAQEAKYNAMEDGHFGAVKPFSLAAEPKDVDMEDDDPFGVLKSFSDESPEQKEQQASALPNQLRYLSLASAGVPQPAPSPQAFVASDEYDEIFG